MPGRMVSSFILLVCVLLGGFVSHLYHLTIAYIFVSCASGFLIGLVVIYLMGVWLKQSPQALLGGAVGFCVGVVVSSAIALTLSGIVHNSELLVAPYCLGTAFLCLIGMELGSSKAAGLTGADAGHDAESQTLGILDTSVIIDGRISDVCETGFLRGELILPQFVLRELQSIADSAESTKRTRGRRGLDIINRMKKQSYNRITITNTDYPNVKDVDQKLINLAKDTGAAILTNDYNLNKVAEVHSIQALNMNQLANALKPVILPGETVRLQVVKEGKEPGQGVAYLDDGTMVVVDQGRQHMGRTIDVTVTSVLQTTAGRMIFAMAKR